MAIVFTQNDIDALKDALVTGASEVQIGERRIKYRSQKEILEAIKMAEEQINAIPNTPIISSNLIQAKFSKGET